MAEIGAKQRDAELLKQAQEMEAINRPVELLRVMLNYAVDERMISPDQNPFSQRSTKSLIERSGETSRERFPTFGEELASINYWDKPSPHGNEHLRAVLIIAADTGFRRINRHLLRSTRRNRMTFWPRTPPCVPILNRKKTDD